jgi:HEAT repeat protein
MECEVKRLEKIRGLPRDFWKVIHARQIEFIGVGLEFQKNMPGAIPLGTNKNLQGLHDLFKSQGSDKIIAVRLANLRDDYAEKVHGRILAAAPGATLIDYDENEMPQVFLGPVADFQKFRASLDLGKITFEDEPQRLMIVEVDRRKFGYLANSDEEEERLRQEAEKRKSEAALREAAQREEKLKEERARIEKQEQARREKEQADLEAKNRLPDPRDADYYDRLADRLLDPQYPQRGKALDILVRTEPRSVPSLEARKKIARAFKRIVEDGQGFEQEKAIRGLVVWGGKYSVPILIETLRAKPAYLGKPLVKVLGELKDPSAVKPLIGKLGDFTLHQVACEALVKIGPPAEGPLLQAASSGDPKIRLTVVKLLGEVGAEKSLPLLRRELAGGTSADLRNAARTALEKIDGRLKANKSAGS